MRAVPDGSQHTGGLLMEFLKMAAIIVAAYLLGSLNSAIIVSRLMLGVDIRNYGSGNAGSTNAFRTMGGKKALIVMGGDILKGVAAVAIGAWLAGDMGKLVAGVFVVVGHVFPLYFGFKGGKGVLTAATMIALIDWRVFLVIFAVFLLAFLLTRYVSLGSVLAAFTFPFAMWYFHRDAVMTAIAAAVGLGVIWLHRSNIGRIAHGTESKLSFKQKPKVTEKEHKK